MTFGFMYGQYSRAVSNQEGVIVVRVRYLKYKWDLLRGFANGFD